MEQLLLPMTAPAHQPQTRQQVQSLVKRFQQIYLIAVVAMCYAIRIQLKTESLLMAWLYSTVVVIILGLAIFQITLRLMGKRRAWIRSVGFILPTAVLPPLILVIPLVYLADHKRAQYCVE